MKTNPGQFLTQVLTCTCEVSHGRGNRTPKPKRQSPKPYRSLNQKSKIIAQDLLVNFH